MHIAEWILALVTTPDRAVSTTGDLTEQAATRGVVWFWSHVLRTAASLLWRDMADHPGRLTRLAFLGLAVYIGIDLLFAGASGVAFLIAGLVSGYPLHLDSIGWKIWFIAPILVSSLLIGRILASRAPGRELAACLVFAILISVYDLVPMFGNNGGFPAVLCSLIVLTGAAWGRYRRVGATQLKPV